MGNSSEVVRGIFLHFKKKCKEQKKRVEIAEKELERTRRGCHFDDEMSLVESAERDLLVEQAKLRQLVKDKISIEKYWRKLKHEEEEAAK